MFVLRTKKKEREREIMLLGAGVLGGFIVYLSWA
jgi:hypothetical protein